MSEPSSPSLKFVILVAFLALGLGAAANWWLHQQDNYQPEAASIWPKPVKLEPFKLVDHKNQPFTEQNLQGKWSLFFFGYTHCPDVCPTTLAILNNAVQKLAKSPDIYQQIQIIFVSVDPNRDKPENLASYVEYFNPSFIGATGSNADVQNLLQQVSLPYALVPPSEQAKPNYLVDHSSTLILINPDGMQFAFFGSPHEAKKIANDLFQMISW
jgi:protein SCO1